MNKEEKEVVNMIKTGLEVLVEGQIIEQIHISRKEAKALLNLIQKQNKIIDKFSKALVNCVGTCPIDYNDDFENDCENCQDTLEKCWIEFFKKEVEKC